MKLSSIAGAVVLLAVSTNAARAQNGFVITDVNLAGFQVVDGVLTAAGTVEGTLAGLPFTADITKFALRPVADNPATKAVECSVLDLELGPINLALLGLHVDTSAICLRITATEGGGLLGDLLCSLADGGLLRLLPTDGQLTSLLGGLTDLLNGVLGNRDPSPGQGGGDSVCTGECEILELVLGPLKLSLLGLNVSLDDCEGGPVQVCISASAGEGLLGNLLCNLTNIQILNLDLADIARLTTRALALLADGSLSRRDIGDLTALLVRLIR